METRKLPLGKSDFKIVIEDNYLYVDKTLFLKEVMDKGDTILLIPRPRRFGKTLNLSTLKYFYDCCPETLLRDFDLLHRYDIMIFPRDISLTGYVIEFKTVDQEENETVESAVESALNQIEERKYETELKERGIKNIRNWRLYSRERKSPSRKGKDRALPERNDEL